MKREMQSGFYFISRHFSMKSERWTNQMACRMLIQRYFSTRPVCQQTMMQTRNRSWKIHNNRRMMSSATNDEHGKASTGNESQHNHQQQQEHQQLNSDASLREPNVARGPIRWKSLVILVIAGVATLAYAQYRSETKRVALNPPQAAGKPLIGGSYVLTDCNGKEFDSKKLKKYALVYFGFTNCPDVCPTEMAKMIRALKMTKLGELTPVPIFISIDPHRDTVEALRAFADSYPAKNIVWLTGTEEQIKDVTRKFRVYYSAPEMHERNEMYLVDHSIFFYLMGKDGEFLDYFGKNKTADDMALRIKQIITEDSTR